MVIAAGLNAKFCIETSAVFPGVKSGPGVCPAGGLVWAIPGAVAGFELLLQEAAINIADAINNITVKMDKIFFINPPQPTLKYSTPIAFGYLSGSRITLSGSGIT
jgi:hypothetical protein